MKSVVSTWPFSKFGLDKAVHALKTDCTATEAVEIGIRAVELDPDITSAGYGGLPNALGTLQLDAAMMTSGGSLGAVMALEGFATAIDHASLVMHHSPHPVLAGHGAQEFAIGKGLQPISDLLTPQADDRYQQFIEENGGPSFHEEENMMPHSDTVGMIAQDLFGNITAGCATSGMQFKAVGRVGDSPIVGAGIFADSAGAAVASGDGDKLLRFCLTFLVVERLRMGDSPDDACHYAIKRVSDTDSTCQAAVVAMSRDGTTGAACTHDGFDIVRWHEGMEQSETQRIDGHYTEQWRHACA